MIITFLKQRYEMFLTKGLKIVLREHEEELIERTFHYEGGIKEFVTYLNKSKEALYEDVIYCEGMVNNVQVEVAMQHNDSYNETTYNLQQYYDSGRRYHIMIPQCAYKDI